MLKQLYSSTSMKFMHLFLLSAVIISSVQTLITTACIFVDLLARLQ